MNIKLQSVHFDADHKLLDFVKSRVEKIDHFYHHVIDVDVILKLEKSVTHENKIVEIKMHVPGKMLFVKEHSNTFEKAADMAVEGIIKQVKREKEKVQGL